MEFRSREQRPAGRFVQPLSPHNGRPGAFLPEPALPRPPPGPAPAPHLGGERRPPAGWKMERELPSSAFLLCVSRAGSRGHRSLDAQSYVRLAVLSILAFLKVLLFFKEEHL